MRVAIGSDHAGFEMKRFLAGVLEEAGHDLLDLGTDSTAPVDYPDIARDVGEAVRSGRSERGIIVCGSGAGAAIAANKLRGVRAAQAHDTYTAHQCVEHDDANVLALGGRVIGVEVARELALTFLSARFTGEERHRRRLSKIDVLEEELPPQTIQRTDVR